MPSESAIELGQFDDAPEPGAPPPTDLRQAGHALIDDAELLQWSEDEDEAADADADEDELDERDFDDARVEDEDWEMAERGTRPPPPAASPPRRRAPPHIRFHQAV